MKMFEIYKDGKLLASVDTESKAWKWIHDHTPFSVKHATTCEGYEIKEERENKQYERAS